jgi:serine/threonine-protein kinase RsbW
MSWLRFSFASSLDEIFLVSLVLGQVCRHLGLDEALAYKIELCAVEGVTNSIRHAYQQRAGNEVTVLIRFDRARVDLEIQDRGSPMPPQFVERLRNGSRVLDFDPSDIAALPENGMGLQIIHEVMDETAYSTIEGINCLRLTKLLAPREAA